MVLRWNFRGSSNKKNKKLLTNTKPNVIIRYKLKRLKKRKVKKVITMTQRELMNAIINHEPITEEMVETAKGIIEHMNKANESKKSKTSEKRATEIAPIIEKINTFLNGKEEPILASEIAEYCKVSVPKITPILKGMENIEVSEVKVKGKGIRKAYKIR